MPQQRPGVVGVVQVAACWPNAYADVGMFEQVPTYTQDYNQPYLPVMARFLVCQGFWLPRGRKKLLFLICCPSVKECALIVPRAAYSRCTFFVPTAGP